MTNPDSDPESGASPQSQYSPPTSINSTTSTVWKDRLAFAIVVFILAAFVIGLLVGIEAWTRSSKPHPAGNNSQKGADFARHMYKRYCPRIQFGEDWLSGARLDRATSLDIRVMKCGGVGIRRQRHKVTGI